MAYEQDTTEHSSEADNAEQQQDSFLGKSDEEIASMDLGFLNDEPESSAADDDTPDDQDTDSDEDDDGAEAEGAEGDAPAVGDGESEDADEDDQEDDDTSADDDADQDTDPDADKGEEADTGDQDDDSDEEDKDTDEPIDYKAAYEQLTAPFKANGRELKVDSVDEAIQLMQMGANYNKKMAALKPHLKMVKMLENNQLLDEDKINFLIDVNHKNPQAIAKLLKDSNIDPMDVNTDQGEEYQPNTYNVDDREMDLDMVIDELKGSPNYASTIELVSNKWDKASKQAVANAPQLLKVINEHMETGVYDVISREMDKQRVFGKLNGLSDIEAYKQVGDSIQAQGGFDHLFQKSGNKKAESVERKVVTPKSKTADEGRKAKRRAAAPSKTAAPAKKQPDFNPLDLSDDEFEKLGNSKFM